MSQDIKNSSRTILVVDDEADICDALQLALGMEGFIVKAALDRDEALRICAEEAPAAVLFDYRMPGLDAAQFVAQLHSHCTGMPVILMTAGKDPGATARQLGLQHFLAKPFELDEMLGLVKRCANGEEHESGGAGASAV